MDLLYQEQAPQWGSLYNVFVQCYADTVLALPQPGHS
jgi:hypothetical protein